MDITLTLLKMMESKDKYTKYYDFVNKNCDVHEIKTILNGVDQYHSKFANDIDWDTFKTWFYTSYPSAINGSKNQIIYDKIFQNVKDHKPVDDKIAIDVLDSVVTRNYASQLADIALNIADGKPRYHMDDLLDKWYEYSKAVDLKTHNDYIVRDNLPDLVNTLKVTGGFEWRIKPVQESLGSLTKSSLIVIGARPDSGKTTFVGYNAVHWAKQMPPDEVGIWFNNEEDGRKVKRRLVQCATACTVQEMEKDAAKYDAEYQKYINGDSDKIMIYDKSSIHMRDIEAIIREHDGKIGFMIFDQLRKIKGFDNEKADHKRVEYLYQWARELSKDYAPTLAIHQASDSAEGLAYIPMNLLEGSRTGLQGEADAIIMLGRVHGTSSPNSRFLNIPKNKLDGGGGDRNMKAELTIDPIRGQWT